MGITVINRARLQQLSESELRHECRKLSKAWELAGRPDEAEMPRTMLHLYIALQVERERRGQQLRLF
jgi:hypothetical protein